MVSLVSFNAKRIIPLVSMLTLPVFVCLGQDSFFTTPLTKNYSLLCQYKCPPLMLLLYLLLYLHGPLVSNPCKSSLLVVSLLSLYSLLFLSLYDLFAMLLKSVAGWDNDLLELVSSKEECELK
ncbi:hypothetical protein RO3G_09106 [Rhizopus delemar RA 99-880]|uniref:Uncharacterized protein n=1 Tax=Rhizopus delemar (strain RA 99-880 / ATCC MYA-4621 / FGSC 9543 / NRRL 43880) TaxID=246409 RepID=I1C7G6_RHIO9|nr:hypothetical protein RO3G_09106 [Rhizopus delemar RA 99-880]|eukprot:EIE84396.1 hypothetical protein RO3G_09106 [Rhizopus delemar RA 99-880]